MTEDATIIHLSIPLFFAAIFIEVLITWKRKSGKYRVNDSINSLSCGITSEIMKLYLKWMTVIPYAYIYKRHAIYQYSMDSWFDWLLVVLLVDMAYYWFHRSSHAISLFWSAHSAHHSSEEFNFSTALRQAFLGHVVDPLFYLPLALMFPPKVFEFHIAMNIIYQFWVHTELVDKMPPIVELIFNTPSHHRVHHARNPEYLDKNYGGIFIIWDRMFGTFEPETIKPVYGLVHPLNTWGNLWQQLHHLAAVANQAINTPGLINKVRVAFAPPGYSLDAKGQWVKPTIPLIDPKHTKFDPQVPLAVNLYVLAQFASTIAAYIIFSIGVSKLAWVDKLIGAVYLFICLEVYGFVLEGYKKGLLLEVIRLALSIMLLIRIANYTLSTALWAWAIFHAIDTVWCFSIHKNFGKVLLVPSNVTKTKQK